MQAVSHSTTNVFDNAFDDIEDIKFHLAGERVPAGRYRQIESSREILLEKEDVLPASLDGRVACYKRVHSTWEDLCSQQAVVASS